MNRAIMRSFLLGFVALLASVLPISAASGSAVPEVDPADQAAEAYNRGLASRDKAWDLEKEAASSPDAEQKAKLLNKAQKEYGKAMRAFRSATESDPQMYQAFSSLGYVLRKTGQFEDSLAAYNQALELEPGYTEAIEYRAEAYLGLNRLTEVKEAYMHLFREDRERADELLAAMQSWVKERQSDSSDLDSAVVDEFSAWVNERSEISDNTASLGTTAGRTW